MDTKSNLNRVESPTHSQKPELCFSLSLSIILCSFSLLSSNHHHPLSLSLKFLERETRTKVLTKSSISLWSWRVFFGVNLSLLSSSRVPWPSGNFTLFFFFFLSLAWWKINGWENCLGGLIEFFSKIIVGIVILFWLYGV